MFEVGEKIMYPLQGGGIIKEIENINAKAYYKIHIPNTNVQIRIPVENAEGIGLRKPGAKKHVQDVITRIGQSETQLNGNWNLRYKENVERLKSGTLEQVATVVKLLEDQELKKRLSLAENQLLSMARQIVLVEIIFAWEITEEKAIEFLANWLNN